MPGAAAARAATIVLVSSCRSEDRPTLGSTVQDPRMSDLLQVVESSPAPDEGAAVMTDQTEVVRPDRAHHVEDVARHGALRVGLGSHRFRLVAGAVAAQIGHDHPIGVSEPAGDVAPHEVRLSASREAGSR